MSVYKRENYLQAIRGFYHDPELIKVITGVRRCGKSCLMESIAQELREHGIDEHHIVYLDLDVRKCRKIKTADQLESLIDELTPSGGRTYLFIYPKFILTRNDLLQKRKGIVHENLPEFMNLCRTFTA